MTEIMAKISELKEICASKGIPLLAAAALTDELNYYAVNAPESKDFFHLLANVTAEECEKLKIPAQNVEQVAAIIKSCLKRHFEKLAETKEKIENYGKPKEEMENGQA